MAACSVVHYYHGVHLSLFDAQTPRQLKFQTPRPTPASLRFHSATPSRLTVTLTFSLHSSLSFASIAEEDVAAGTGDLEFVEVGYVSDVHGLDGEIRVKHNTDFPELRFSEPGKRWLRRQFSGREDIFEVELVEGRGHPGSKSWIVKLSGFDSVDQARHLVGSTFLVRNIDRPELEEGEFYSRDLVGMRVILKDTGETVGTVINVLNNGGNDLLRVLLESSTGSSGEGLKRKLEKSEALHRVYIPFVEAIVPDVDMDKREMRITPPKGLLELNLRSSDTSKKERRLSEWRERKKFQRRLISAKKKLCELEQQHIFHGFQYGEKTQRSLLSDQIISVNSNLLQQALQAIERPANGCNLGEVRPDAITWKCGNSLKISLSFLTSARKEKLDTYSEFCRIGVRLLSEGKYARVLVLNRITSESHLESNDLDIDMTAISYLERLLSDKQTFMQAEERESIPIILILPIEEIKPFKKILASHDYFGFDPEKVRLLPEEKLPVVSTLAEEQKKNKVLMKSPWEIHQSSIGFGGIIGALASNNIVGELIESGVEYIEVCSINNQRLACGNPVLLGFISSQETDIGIVTFENDIKLEDDLHVILPMKSLQKLVKQMEKLPLHAVVKSYSHVELIDKKWVDVIPSTPNAYEFRCSLQSLLGVCSLAKACFVEVTS